MTGPLEPGSRVCASLSRRLLPPAPADFLPSFLPSFRPLNSAASGQLIYVGSWRAHKWAS